MPKKVPPEVATYLTTLSADQRKTVVRLRNAVLRAKPSLTQTINPWGYLTFSTSEEKHAFTLVPHKKHVNLQIWNGARIASKLPDLEGTGKGLRHIKFPYDKPVNGTLVGKAIRMSLAA